jgi:hypothetical protein
MTRRRRFLLLSGLVLLLAAAGALPATATHQGEGVADQVDLRLSYQLSALAGVSDQLVVEVRGEDGVPLVGVEVDFVREVEFLGPRRIRLGRAVTDTAGTAYLPIRPSESTLRIVATFAGNDSYEPADIATEIVVPQGASGPDHGLIGTTDRASLALIAETMPRVLAIAALAVWVVLFGLAGLTALAIWRGRASPQPGSKEGVDDE